MTTSGIEAVIGSRGGQAPVFCPSCQKVHLTVDWNRSVPTTYAIDVRDEVPQLKKLKGPPEDPS